MQLTQCKKDICHKWDRLKEKFKPSVPVVIFCLSVKPPVLDFFVYIYIYFLYFFGGEGGREERWGLVYAPRSQNVRIVLEKFCFSYRNLVHFLLLPNISYTETFPIVLYITIQVDKEEICKKQVRTIQIQTVFIYLWRDF